MHPQLQAIADELEEARRRLERLSAAVPDELWGRRAATGHWSVGECVGHLNLTSRAFIPPLRAALSKAPEQRSPPGRYRRDPIGWLVWRAQSPTARQKMRTSEAFIPEPSESPESLRAEFNRLQDDLLECVPAADGLAIHKVKIESPFDPRIRYNAYAALTMLPRHQLRHLWQAERVAAMLEAARV